MATSEATADVPCNELVNVSEFIDSWRKMSEYDFDLIKQESQHIKEVMKMDGKMYHAMSLRCSEDLLYYGLEEKAKFPGLDVFHKDVKLTSVKLLQTDVKKRNEKPKYRNIVLNTQKQRALDIDLISDLPKKTPPAERKIVHPDALLQITLFKPNEKGKKLSRSLSLSSVSLEHVFAVLGQQKLTDLRDRICCVNDLLVTGDYSEDPDININLCARDVFKSGFFFIENVFYDDTRESDSPKYSNEIIEWAAKSDVHYESKKMEETKFSDLSLQIGYPYLYMHQGNCEHLLVITDLRMVHPHESLDIQDYPYLIKRPGKKRTVCRVCAFDTARWMTDGSVNSLENPSFFCDVCFRSLHYDQDGKKIGTFKAFKYFDSHTVI